MHAVSLRCDISLIQISLLEQWGGRLPLLLIEGHEYLVGSHVAELLKRETFNLYSSLKRRSIPIWHAFDDLLKFLIKRGSVYVGTTSVSLLRLSDISDFVSAAVEEDARRTDSRKGLASKMKKKQKRLPIEGAEEKRDFDLLIAALEEQYWNYGPYEQADDAVTVPVVAPPTMVFLKPARAVADAFVKVEAPDVSGAWTCKN